MDEESKVKTWGGARKNAGRPKLPPKPNVEKPLGRPPRRPTPLLSAAASRRVDGRRILASIAADELAPLANRIAAAKALIPLEQADEAMERSAAFKREWAGRA